MPATGSAPQPGGLDDERCERGPVLRLGHRRLRHALLQRARAELHRAEVLELLRDERHQRHVRGKHGNQRLLGLLGGLR